MLQGRICAQTREGYTILHGLQEIAARVGGRFRHETASRIDYPAVGDEVLFEPNAGGPAIVHEILPRRSAIVRKAAGTGWDEQAIAANVDYLLVVCGLDGDFNVRRIERYAALAASGGVAPVLVLNKADLCTDVDRKLLELEDANLAMPIHVIAASLGEGLETLGAYLSPGTTLALAGSSGAGKSTLANALLGRDSQATGAVRTADARGRHTTTARQLFTLPSGAFLIDTPGMRELQLWAGAQAIDEAFDDIAALARACKFSDCAHETEPECAVRAALGVTLEPARLENYRKLQRERAHLERKTDARANAEAHERRKRLHREAQQHMRFKRRWR